MTLFLFYVGDASTEVCGWEHTAMRLSQSLVESATHVIQLCFLCWGQTIIKHSNGFLDNAKLEHVQHVTRLGTKYAIFWIAKLQVSETTLDTIL